MRRSFQPSRGLCRLQCRRKHLTTFKVTSTQLIETWRDAAGQHTEVYERVKAAPWMKNIRRSLLQFVPAGVLFYFVKSAKGRGGFFHAPNIVVVGIEDAQELRLKAQMENPLVLFSLEDMIKQIAAHELGHYLYHRRDLGAIVPLELVQGLASSAGAGETDSVVEEGCADYLGGTLQARCGWNRHLGELASRAVGCIGAACDHPSPDWRGWAFNAGYQDELAAQQQQAQQAALQELAAFFWGISRS